MLVLHFSEVDFLALGVRYTRTMDITIYIEGSSISAKVEPIRFKISKRRIDIERDFVKASIELNNAKVQVAKAETKCHWFSS